ncbi:MAG: hypothetical protein ABR499_12070 [Gemmatimonadaceae bacterium]
MRLVCLHADTVDALKRLSIQFDDLTPNGLWSSQYHLVGLTPDQVEALELFQVQAEDVTPAQLIQAGGASTQAVGTPRVARHPGQGTEAGQTQSPAAGALAGQRAVATVGAASIAGTPEQMGSEQGRAGASAESEVPLAQARDAGTRGGQAKTEPKPEARVAGQASAQASAPQGSGTQASPSGSGSQAGGQKNAGAKGGGAPVATPPAQGGRKGQQAPAPQSGGQRYGTTRLRISVAGKYTEATVANGKIVVGGRTFDSPDQAAAELTKSRGDWTFWEYYDSADGKWRMLTRDWDTVLKSATPGGR